MSQGWSSTGVRSTGGSGASGWEPGCCAGAATFDVGWLKEAAQTASGEMKMMGAMCYEWAGGIFVFVTPIGSLDELSKIGAVHQRNRTPRPFLTALLGLGAWACMSCVDTRESEHGTGDRSGEVAVVGSSGCGISSTAI